MRERPISFSPDMVRAILEGRKTQTRRPVQLCDLMAIRRGDAEHYRGVPVTHTVERCLKDVGTAGLLELCPGLPGDRLWVKEPFREAGCTGVSAVGSGHVEMDADWLEYRADGHSDNCKWKPAIRMKREDSRILLEITNVRVERLQDIEGKREDVIAEGFDPRQMTFTGLPLDFAETWNRLYAKRPGLQWAANPWVWVIEFRRVEG